MNVKIGKPFAEPIFVIDIYHLINETAESEEYETGFSNGCTWAVKVNKKTNLVDSWRITSSIQLCEEGTNVYG